MNDGNRGNNLPPDRGQNNIMTQALVALVQVIENIQPAPVQGSRKQNIAQISKFNRYDNEDLTEQAKRFDVIYLMNNQSANRQ